MHLSIWNEIVTHISQSIDAQRFDIWIRPLVPVESDKTDTLILAVKNKFVLESI